MPRNEEQNDYYFNLVGGRQQHDMWLGFSDELQEGTWLDANGEPVTWFKWWSGEPNNANSGGNVGQGEHWIEMDLSGRHGYSDAGEWLTLPRGEVKAAKKNLYHFSTCACHPCAGAMLIFSVSFQF